MYLIRKLNGILFVKSEACPVYPEALSVVQTTAALNVLKPLAQIGLWD